MPSKVKMKGDGKKIRILVVEPNKAPRQELVDPLSWRTWYPLIDPSTELFQTLNILPGIDMLFDEEGRFKQMPLNVLVPAHAPAILMEDSFLIDMTGGRGMKPGEPGIGYHEILGTFLLARRRGGTYVDLTDDDITKLRKAFIRAV